MRFYNISVFHWQLSKRSSLVEFDTKSVLTFYYYKSLNDKIYRVYEC